MESNQAVQLMRLASTMLHLLIIKLTLTEVLYFNTLFMFFYPITKDVKTNRIDNLTILLYELTVNIENKLNLI